MELDERVVGEGVRRPELHSVQHGAGENATAWELEPERRHQHEEHDRREREAEASTPQGIELAVRDANADAVASGKDGAREERGERGPFVSLQGEAIIDDGPA